MDFSPANKMCSFCGKQGTRKSEFVGGFGVMMCVECLDFFHAAVHSPARKRALRQPPWVTMSDAELLGTLPLILRSAEQVNSFAAEWVGLIRERRLSWAQVGKALGVSRQAAWVRFADVDDAGEPTKAQKSRRA